MFVGAPGFEWVGCTLILLDALHVREGQTMTTPIARLERLQSLTVALSIQTRGSLLGIEERCNVQEGSTQLRVGDLLVLYTDGLLGRNLETAADLLASVGRREASATEVADGLVSAATQLQGDTRFDDIAVVVMGARR